MGFFDTVGGQDLKKLYGAGVGAAKDLGSYMLDNTFYGTGKDMDIVKGLGQYLMSPAPKSQIEEIKKFREQEDDIVNMMGGMPEYTGLPPALGSYEARQMSPGEFKSRFGSPSFGQDSGLAIGDDSANIQNEIQRIKGGKEAEDFRSKEAQIIKEQGGVTNKDKGLIRSGENIKNMDDAFTGGMSAYMEALGGQLDDQKKKGQKPSKSNKELLEYYKKEFADATGISIDGKPDKRDALMAFGLALMQNKAGKGFNVGKMLAATGEAGEKALPLLTKAQDRAKAEQVAAGKYALGQIAAGKSASAALAAEERAFAKEVYLAEMKREDEREEAKLKGEEIKGGYFDERLKGLDIRMGNTAKGAVFSNPPAALNKVNDRLKATNGGIATVDEITGLAQSIINKDYTTLSLVQDRVNSVLVGFGIKDANLTFGKSGVSDEDNLKALQDSLISRYKKFLTQETGNGISNTDVERLQALLGQIDLVGNPEGSLIRLEEVRQIFEGERKKARALSDELMDPSFYASQEIYDSMDFNKLKDENKNYTIVTPKGSSTPTIKV